MTPTETKDQVQNALERAREIARVCTEEFRASMAQMVERTSVNIGAHMLTEICKMGSQEVVFPTKERDGIDFPTSAEFWARSQKEYVNGNEVINKKALVLGEFVIHRIDQRSGRGTVMFISIVTNLGRVGQGSLACVRFPAEKPDDPTYEPMTYLNKPMCDLIKNTDNLTQIYLMIKAYRLGCPKLNELHDLWLARQESGQATKELDKQAAELKTRRDILANIADEALRGKIALEEEKKAFEVQVERQAFRVRAFNENVGRALALLRSAAASVADLPGVATQLQRAQEVLKDASEGWLSTAS